MPSKQSPVGEIFAFLAIAWPFATLVLTALLYWAGVSIGPLHLWAGLVVALVAGRFAAVDWRTWVVASVALALLTLAGGAALGWLLDFSGDGQWYHLPAIIALAEGWNPILTPALADWNADFAREVGSGAIYVQHYSKGAWIVAAAAYRATGALEAAKVFTLLCLAASWVTALGLLRGLGLGRAWSHALALAVALNPVVLYQLPSFFVDGQLAALCTLLLLLSLRYLVEPRWDTLVLVAATAVLLANTKFTGLVYAVALGGGLLALALLRRLAPARRYGLAGVAAIVGAVLVVGYQPYVTNALSHGNPFYPAVGRDAAATAATARQFEIWAPPEFMRQNRVEKLARSLFAASGGAESMPRWKLPFTVSKQELYIFFNTEPRYGGFGPFFGAALIVAVLAFGWARASGVREAWTAALALASLVVVSVLLNPEAWWARLSPHLWLVPSLLVAAVALGASAWPRRAGAAVLAVLIGNALLVAGLNWGRAVEKNLAFRSDLARLRAMASAGAVDLTLHPSFQLVTERRLRAAGVAYRISPRPGCPAPLRFSYPAAAQAVACPSARNP